MMRNMLRNSVLVMTAAAALITGVTIAAAQSGGGMTGDRGSHAARSGGGSGTHQGSGMHQSPSGGGHAVTHGRTGGKVAGVREHRKHTVSTQRGTRGKTARTQVRTRAQASATTRGRTGAHTKAFAQGRVQGNVSLTSQQRTRIHNIVLSRNFTSRFRVTNITFDIRIGVVVPRSFHLFVVPEEFVVIVPRFRGFLFFIVEEEIVLVDPVTFEIVAIIPA